ASRRIGATPQPQDRPALVILRDVAGVSVSRIEDAVRLRRELHFLEIQSPDEVFAGAMRRNDENLLVAEFEQMGAFNVVGLALERLKNRAKMHPLTQVIIGRTIELDLPCAASSGIGVSAADHIRLSHLAK